MTINVTGVNVDLTMTLEEVNALLALHQWAASEHQAAIARINAQVAPKLQAAMTAQAAPPNAPAEPVA